MSTDTIFALSSGALPAAIAIVRISGPEAEAAAVRLAGPLPPPRSMSLRSLAGADGTMIDRALIVFFPAPHTATGEPLVEFHLHGGRAVVARLLSELGAMPNLREAEPGEFTRRALVNARLDLTETEGLADLLAAETEWQRRAAMESVGGALRRTIEAWRDRLVLLAAEAEAAIDYVDEEETELELSALCAAAAELASEWRQFLDAPRSEMMSEGLRIVLGGPPNSGKSSLFNALLRTDKAIVTPIPGTTRDVIEARLDLDGLPVLLVDTAGLRETADAVEQIGVVRAAEAQRGADLLLWLGDPADAPENEHKLLVHARADEREEAPPGSIPASVMSPNGLDALRRTLTDTARSLLPPADRAALNRRQAAALREAEEALRSVQPQDSVLTAEALRSALLALDRLSGRQGTEDVLDALFGRFCLGK